MVERSNRARVGYGCMVWQACAVLQGSRSALCMLEGLAGCILNSWCRGLLRGSLQHISSMAGWQLLVDAADGYTDTVSQA